jgi:hypothetical protein
VFVVTGYHVPHGAHVGAAIKNVMNRVGETKYALDTLRGHLHSHRTVAPGSQPWQVVVGGGTDANGHAIPSLVGKSGGHHYVFYDGAGVLTAKKRPGPSVWKFTDDHILTHPGIKYDIMNFRNTVVVKGGTPKHSKKHYHGTAKLPASHPMSAHALARHGHPRNLVTFFESDSLKSDHACRTKARQLLHSASNEGVDVSFDCLPIPHLEPMDQITLAVDGYTVKLPLTTYTLPLTTDTPMSVGYTRPATPKHHKKHKKHHHHGGH